MYLSKIYIKNFRGIKELTVEFNSKLNVIIGANGQLKTSLIDAIRLFYSWGEPNRDLEITRDDFYVDLTNPASPVQSTRIDIVYIFEDLTPKQEGAYYLYLEAGDDGKFRARVHLSYELMEKGRIKPSLVSGRKDNEQRVEWDSLHYFHTYYLGALRDSTRDLLSTRNNLLGRVIKRKIDKAKTEDAVKDIIKQANDSLLNRDEVKETKKGINDNLEQINRDDLDNVSLHIEQSRVEYIVNVIKPFLPFKDNATDGFMLTQNSLGYNNLIYIASVLSDIKDCHEDDDVSIYSLLIEEPEAHLHPQLQVNLYNFLEKADNSPNSQTFITTHSPTLTSKIPLENLILMRGHAYNVGECFKERHTENIVRDVAKKSQTLKEEDVKYYRNMIVRYFDVTRSQLLFSNGALFIEGISECQLVETFSQILGKSLKGHQIEIVDTDGTAFYQFLMLFNSSKPNKRLPLKSAFITDGDQFTDSKNYSLDKLVANDYEKLAELRNGINTGKECCRIANMKAMSNKQANIKVCSGLKTLEYQICKANVKDTKAETQGSWLYELIKTDQAEEMKKVETYLDTIEGDSMTEEQQQNVALLLWKCLPSKAGFAQRLDAFLVEKMESEKETKFTVPQYIADAINHLVS